MAEALNIPYVKKYDNNGQLINPIRGAYISEFSNRKQRREILNEPPFFGCSKNVHLSVVKTGKYLRVRQFVTDKNGDKKVIEHYIDA